MKQLAIKGHPTRGSEVIFILKMLGGEVKNHIGGFNDELYYFIDTHGSINCSGIEYEELACKYIIFTIEEFEEKFPYKVGDKVKTSFSFINYIGTVKRMKWKQNENVVIYEVEWSDAYKSTLTYYAQQLQPYKKQETMKNTRVIINDNGDKISLVTLTSGITEIEIGNNHEIIEKNGRYYAVKKKPKYPKTYEECCDILNTCINTPTVPGYKGNIVAKLQQLLICRDAYWKLARDWKPNWDDETLADMYYISYDVKSICNIILVFPTEEMRDAFYENFKELIESCKELL